MSLFSARSEIDLRIIDPSQVEIEGEINGSFFAGRIEMKFFNQNSKLDNFKLLIGKNENSKICLHDFQVKIDENPFVLKLMEVNEAKEIFEQKVSNNEQAIFGVGDDSYASIDIPNILSKQLVTISVNFELPVTYISENNIGIFFPITYPGTKYDEIMKCSNFKFSLNFQSLQLNENSISSNPEGTIDLSKFSYFIDKLEPSITFISIMIDLNQSILSEHFSQMSSSSFQIATCCGKYGSLMFIPTKEVNEESIDHSGEEFIFIVDCSGSMSGREIELASQCLTFFIKSLPEKCYFNVIRFGSQFIPLFDTPVPYTDSNACTALQLAKKLKADLGGTILSNPLNYVFSKKLSEKNKLRRVFVLTDGCVFDPSEVISIVERNSNTTMSSAIGIGYGVDKDLVKGIGRAGKGFVDFVLSGDDMRSKVINQLSESLNGLCKVDISIENDETVEILPPLSYHQFSPGIPATVYFKSSEEFKDNTHIIIDVEGNSEQKIVKMKTLPSNSSARRSLEYLFNNENIKYLRNLEQTDEVKSTITKLSIGYEILTPYTGLIGTQEYKSDEEKERIKSLIEKENQNKYKIYVKTLLGKRLEIFLNPNENIENVKKKTLCD
ncbi:von Willebrand factor A domain-containing protein 5A [Tritrichomonas musculus]|uniref:von Willebrand factor A domain-containing protein 5A n=1 Tax=Tritrichomonas musculus TaxID=1915356 RepID=A0ABR2GX48_9EUKA